MAAISETGRKRRRIMRLRNIRGSREIIAASEYVVHEEETRAGTWHALFGNDHPIHIEIGMGKGKFIMAMAKENPHINYAGIEKYSSVLLRAGKDGAGGASACQSVFHPDGCRTDRKGLCPGRGGADLPEFFRPMAQGPPRKAKADQQGIPGTV